MALGPLQWVCVGVGGAQLGLLLSVYLSEAVGRGAYVSDELVRAPTFNLLLTMTVLAQISLSGFYLYDWCDGPRDWRLWLGTAGLAVGLAGWCMVGSTVIGMTEHTVGTSVFFVGSGVYYAMVVNMRARAPARVWFAVALYVCEAGLVTGFAVTHFAGLWAAEAAVEWAGFMVQSVYFAAFFAVHSFRGLKGAPRPTGVELSPLLAAPVWRGPAEREVESGLI